MLEDLVIPPRRGGWGANRAGLARPGLARPAAAQNPYIKSGLLYRTGEPELSYRIRNNILELTGN